MSLFKALKEHQSDYKVEAWQAYTKEELGWWVRLYNKRAQHRLNPEKRDKDLRDAYNYQLMLDEASGV